MTAETVLSVDHLTKTYGALTAANDVSFSLAAGSSLAIVGESGSGKTTIARCIVGLERATSGVITCCGVDRSALARSSQQRRQRGREIQIAKPDIRFRHAGLICCCGVGHKAEHKCANDYEEKCEQYCSGHSFEW